MLLKEWNMDDAQRVRERDGEIRGEIREREKNARNMKAKGMDLHLIAEVTGLSFDEVLNI